jgi:hypothetical protein
MPATGIREIMYPGISLVDSARMAEMSERVEEQRTN